MKEIRALVRPTRLDAVLEGLHAHPRLPGVTVSYAQGFGRRVGREKRFSADMVSYDTPSMVRVECIVDEDLLDEIIETIATAARTGLPGDGKIAIYEVAELVAIRTGERSQTAGDS